MNKMDIRPDVQGKVRDIYDLGDTLLLVASDRISAYDYILDDEIPHKGEVLTRLSRFWFELLDGVVENHLVSMDAEDLPARFMPYKDYLKDRFMLVRKARMFPLECVVRGYLAGNGFSDYINTGMVNGVSLPPGLVNASRLPAPLFSPSTKAEVGDHDESISFAAAQGMVGVETAEALRDLSLKIYAKACDFALERGIIIADTKFEFGVVGERIVLADEVLTPDSSRFWATAAYVEGTDQPSFDKQFIRDWLDAHWDRQGHPPRLPEDVINRTSEKYIQAYEMLTGQSF